MKKIAILVLAVFLLTLMPMAALAGHDNGNKANGNKWIQNNNQSDLGDVDEDDNNLEDEDENQDEDTNPHFNDISGNWAKGYIDKAARKGLVEGYGDRTYQPNKPVTCLEVIKILVTTLDKNGEIDLDTVDVDQYADQLKKIPEWGQVYVAAAIQEGIILESEIQTFNPNQGAKRYQVAQYIARILGENNEEDSIMDFDNLAVDLQEAIDGLKAIDLGDDFDEISSDINGLIDDAKVLKQDLDAADEEDLADLISDIRALCTAMDDILAAAEDKDVDEDSIDELQSVAHKLSQIKKELKAYQNSGTYTGRQFTDEDQIPVENKHAVKRVKQFGIMQGDDDGAFSGMRVVKRDEIAAMLARLCDQYFGDFVTETVEGVLDKVEKDGDDYSITVATDEDNDETFQVTDDTRIIHHQASVQAEDLDEYIGYNVVVIADDDQDASLVKIMGQADDDSNDDEE